MAASQDPQFYCRIRGMKIDRNKPQRDGPSGWRPPKPRGWNRSDEGQLHCVFGFNGNQMVPVDLMTWARGVRDRAIILYRTVSVYYDRGQFWCVESDAIANAVGDGLSPTAEARRSSSSEDDASGDEDDPNVNTADWTRLGFSWEGLQGGYRTTLLVGGPQETLHIERADQAPWTERLIPQPARAPPNMRTGIYPHGGLGGDLSLLIALVAFSVPNNLVHNALVTCVRNRNPHGYGWHGHTGEAEVGWTARRGMIVEIYYPSHVSAEDLAEFEAQDLFI